MGQRGWQGGTCIDVSCHSQTVVRALRPHPEPPCSARGPLERVLWSLVVAEVEELSPTKAAPRLFWWKEVLLIGAFYMIYTFSRNRFGSARLGDSKPTQAFDNARSLIRFEQALGLYHERAIQQFFLSSRWFIWLWNVFYGTFHFIVTIGLFVWMYLRARPMFTKWRNAILATTALALVGFSLFPVMPPRLLDNTSRYGGAAIEAERNIDPFGFHDTLVEVGGLWSFSSGTMSKLSNQYAAMPSLHCGWATWCALVGWRLTRRRWARALLVIYPFLTLFCIVVTGNHYWIDGLGGLATLGIGFAIGHYFDVWNDARLARRSAPTA